MPEKLDFIVKSFRHTHKKRYENYVITGIWHRLRSKNILLKPITQQLVRRADGKYALLDLYFPAINVAIECDEGQHFNSDGDYITEDKLREFDIMKVLGALAVTPDLYRVKAVTSLDEIDNQMEKIMEKIKEKVEKLPETKDLWGDASSGIEFLAENDVLHTSDPVVFRLQHEVLNALGLRNGAGNEYAGFMRGALQLNDIESIWFANLTRELGDSRFYNIWMENENSIYEYDTEKDGKAVWEDLVQKKESYRYTFCRIKDSLGNIAFKFFGKFKLTSGIKHDEDGNRYLIWKKVGDEIHKFN